MGKVELRYRTFDELLNDVMVDFTNYSLEGLIEPQQLIKVAKRISKELGLRIYKTQETILELDRFKVKLPDDFYVFNTGIMCGEHTTVSIIPQGIRTEEIPFPTPLYSEQANVIDTCAGDALCPTPELPKCGGCGNCPTCTTDVIGIPGFNPLVPYGNPCAKPRVFMDCKGASWELIQIIQTQAHHYKHFMPVKLVSSAGHYSPGCPNIDVHCPDHVWIKDGFLQSNMKFGKIYMSYEGMLEDEEGNLLVLDHAIINDYYEYSLKHRILENLYFNGEDVVQKLQYIEPKLRAAKINAISIAKMPDFETMKEVWHLNRRAYNARYVNMFKSYSWYPYGR